MDRSLIDHITIIINGIMLCYNCQWSLALYAWWLDGWPPSASFRVYSSPINNLNAMPIIVIQHVHSAHNLNYINCSSNAQKRPPKREENCDENCHFTFALSLQFSPSLSLSLSVPFCRFHIFIFINFRPKELGYGGQQFWNLIANHALLVRFLCVIY